MRRREFITLLGSAAAWPLAAHAQQPAMPVIGFLHSGSAEPYAGRLAAFRQGLSDAGLIERKDCTIEFRWAEGNYERLREMASDLVARKVSVIVAAGGVASAPIAKAATATIPIVFMTGADPIASGLVTSLARPEANVTGVSFLTQALGGKRLGFLNMLAPGVVFRPHLQPSPWLRFNVTTCDNPRVLRWLEQVAQGGSRRQAAE